MFYFFSNEFIASNVFRWWETEQVSDESIAGKCKIAVVLSGFSYYDHNLGRVHFNASGDRIFQPLRLYKKGYIKKIFISGGSGSMKRPEEKEAALVKKYLIDIGVPEEDIITESKSMNTYENALITKETLTKLGVDLAQPILLVTSGYHMKRAGACFKKQGFHFIPYVANGRSGKGKIYPDELFLPKSHVFDMWETLFHEWIGYGVYFLTGKI